jgi:hypothetical protein
VSPWEPFPAKAATVVDAIAGVCPTAPAISKAKSIGRIASSDTALIERRLTDAHLLMSKDGWDIPSHLKGYVTGCVL